MYPGSPQYPQPFPMPSMPLSPYAQYLATRSAIPKVIGILAICFASVGALGSGIWTFGPLEDLTRWDHDHVWGAMQTWLLVWGGLSVAVFALHLVSGIMSLLYRPSAPRLVTIYAIAALALLVVDLILVNVLAPSGGARHSAIADSVCAMHMVYCGLAFPWPVVAVILMNTKGAKRACVIPPH